MSLRIVASWPLHRDQRSAPRVLLTDPARCNGTSRALARICRVPFVMLITTAFDFPGYETVATQGEIFGLTVRARNIGSGGMAALRSLVGGEIPQFKKLLAQSRNEAMARMTEEARRRGSNAIVAMRFDSGAIGQWSEICSYGTVSWVRPVSEEAQQQYDALVAAGQLPHQDTYELRVSELQRTETVPGARPR